MKGILIILLLDFTSLTLQRRIHILQHRNPIAALNQPPHLLLQLLIAGLTNRTQLPVRPLHIKIQSVLAP